MERQTTHQRMELQAVIKGFEYLAHTNLLTRPVELYTDSQYVCGLPARKTKLKASGFSSARNLPVRNADLVRELIAYIERMNVQFIKVKSHQKEGTRNFNREADKLARKIVREMITKELLKG